MAIKTVVTPANLGNSLDLGAIEAAKIHVNYDGTSIVRDVATGKLSAYTVFPGPALPAAPAADDPKMAMNSTTGAVYAWDGAAWVTPAGGGADTHEVGTGGALSIQLVAGTNAATATGSAALGGDGNTASGTYSAIAGGQSNTASGAGAIAMGTSALAPRPDEMAHGFGALAATGRTTQFRRIPAEAGTVGPGQTLIVSVPMLTNSVWAGTIRVAAQDPGFGGSVEYYISFGSRNVGGAVSVDGSAVLSSFGGGSLSPALLAVTVGSAGGNLTVTLISLTAAASMNAVLVLEVLEIR